MTEPYDPKLVEAVALDIWDRRTPWSFALEQAERALAAIDASGTHWLAPSIMTAGMFAAQIEAESRGHNQWAYIRDACLAERRGEGR